MKKRYIQTCLLILGVHNNFFASYKIYNPNQLNISMSNDHISEDSLSEDIVIPQEKPIEKTIIDADFIKIVMQYYKIIKSWQTGYWYLPGFKAYDMQKLVTAISNDINNHTISAAQLHFILNLLKQHTPTADIEIKNILEIIKFNYQSLTTTYENELLKKIHETIFKITNRNQTISLQAYKQIQNKITPIIGNIKTIDEYLAHQKNITEASKNIINNNLADFNAVIDSRGDGNCGYRSFIISTYMNNPTFAYNYFKKLLEDRFSELFIKYDETFTYQIKDNKNIIAQEILNYLLSTLQQMKKTTSKEELITLLNNETTFDYFIIMFIRYVLADYIQHHLTNQQSEFIKALFEKNVNDFISNTILKWKEELDYAQTDLLAHATGIQIHTIQQNATINSQVKTNLKLILGHAYILFTDNPGHYQILLTNRIELPSMISIQAIKFKFH